jgi:hypothetical protein
MQPPLSFGSAALQETGAIHKRIVTADLSEKI